MTRKQLIDLLTTTPNAQGTISDNDPVVGIAYMSADGGMTTISEWPGDEFIRTMFTEYPVEASPYDPTALQLTMILAPGVN